MWNLGFPILVAVSMNQANRKHQGIIVRTKKHMTLHVCCLSHARITEHFTKVDKNYFHLIAKETEALKLELSFSLASKHTHST